MHSWTSLQDPLLGTPPLQDWTQVRAGQDQAHALTAPCRWGPRHPDWAWDWLWRCVPGRWHPQRSAYGKGCPGVPWRKMRKRWMPQGATTLIRPKTELIATSTWPARLVRHAAKWNLITNPTGWLSRQFEGRILCPNEWHALFGMPPNHAVHFTQGHGIHGQPSLVVHRRVWNSYFSLLF